MDFMLEIAEIVGLPIIVAGSILLYHLGSGSVPGALKPLAHAWVQTGYDPKWINVGMWLLFALLAASMLLFLGIPLYSVVLNLGRGF